MLQNVSRVVVSGASGFIGQAVVPKLLSRGVQVLAISTRPSMLSMAWGIEAVDIETVYEKEQVSKIRLFDPEVFLHMGWSGLPDYSIDACLDNLADSVKLIQLAISLGVERIVSSGSCWEYGDLKGQLSDAQSPKPLSFFARTKDNLRMILESVSKESNVQTRWARIFYAYGPGQREQSLIPITIKSWRDGAAPVLRDTKSSIDLVHVEDVAEALVLLTLSQGPSGVFNIGSGSAVRVSEVVESVRSAIAGELTSLKVLQSTDELAAWADISSISTNFGWAPKVQLADGIRSVVQLD